MNIQKKEISLKEKLGLLFPWARKKIMEQVSSVATIVVYLLFFQLVVLGSPLENSAYVAVGLALVVAGLAFFMEGLVLGMMPLGEVLGLKLPAHRGLFSILVFSFLLGVGATFAEPSIAVLKAAGATVKAWEAPLLFLLLNQKADFLVYSVGIGVGLAVVCGMMRIMYNWSLKPFIYVLVGIACLLTVVSYYNENLQHLLGLAWDCGAVTTGPVTVPLVLALGIGISRISGSGDSENAGFGVVTLASLFPILTVIILGWFYVGDVPAPMTEAQYNSEEMASATAILRSDLPTGSGETEFNVMETVKNSFSAAAVAVVPLCLFLLLTLLWIRQKLPRRDEIFLGIGFAVLGMGLFSIGIEWGLSGVGNQLGNTLPAAYKKIEFANQKIEIDNFDKNLVQTAVDDSGKTHQFYYRYERDMVSVIPWNEENYNAEEKRYNFTPTKGPLYGNEGDLSGIIVVLLFAFFMGYGATLAEPALNALGSTVETITVGTFKKSLLMQAVAIGVGCGIFLGVAKIVWNIPLAAMLVPLYLILLVLSYFSTEEFVNIGWDSAGVTTGPVTVPLVIAMGLGIGQQSAVVEGFGILSMASVCPIMSVLSVGIFVNRSRNVLLESSEDENDGQTPSSLVAEEKAS